MLDKSPLSSAGIASRRVLFVCKGHKNIAGAQLYLKQIASLFSASSWELHYALHKGDGLRVFGELEHTHRVYLWQYDWRHLSFRRSFAIGTRLFKRVRPDMIIFNSSEDKILAPVWASLASGIRKRVMVVHWAQSASDLPVLRRRNGFPFPILSRYSLKTRLFRATALHLLSRIVFVNNTTREAYLRLYRVPARRCSTIYNGIDISSFKPDAVIRSKTRNQLGVTGRELVIFAAGNLTEVKGYEYLIEAMRLLTQKRESLGLRCFIAGQGELEAKLRSRIKRYDLAGSVTLLGYRDDVFSLLNASDIFCMPSLSEALPYGLLEAMAVELPIVASNVGGIPEVVTDEENGLLVPPKDSKRLAEALERLVLNPQLAKKIGRNARKTVKERFTIEKMLSCTSSVLLEELS